MSEPMKLKCPRCNEVFTVDDPTSAQPWQLNHHGLKMGKLVEEESGDIGTGPLRGVIPQPVAGTIETGS